jgi:transcriptional regulator of acetoin/glycerol metabolism
VATGPRKTARLVHDEPGERDEAPQAWLVRAGCADRPDLEPAIAHLEPGGTFSIGRQTQPDHGDQFMSAAHAEVAAGEGGSGWVLRDIGSSNGTWLWGQRRSSSALSDGDIFETGGTFWVFRNLVRADPLPGPPYTGALATVNPDFAATVERLRRVARTRVPVMIQGATGTGKEVLARELHAASKRSGAFVAINTGAIQRSLVASELFGVEAGAHSTAERSRQGLVRTAQGGTLLLDEIGDMPEEVQVAVLRMLQESEIVPVGADHAIRVDLRVVCATHRDLEAMVEAGSFRSDLYARLSGCRLSLPDLADRPEDIGLLIGRFVARYGTPELRFTPAAYRALMLYPWPLNVRELEKAVEAAIAMSERGRIELKDLSEAIQKHRPEPRNAGEDDPAVESEVVRLLRAHRGNINAVARTMGRSRMQVYRWVKRLNLSLDSFRQE